MKKSLPAYRDDPLYQRVLKRLTKNAHDQRELRAWIDFLEKRKDTSPIALQAYKDRIKILQMYALIAS